MQACGQQCISSGKFSELGGIGPQSPVRALRPWVDRRSY